MTTFGPGPSNSLLDVEGLRVGQAPAQMPGSLSGVTVVVAAPAERADSGAGDETGMVAGVDVRGGGPGTRETDLLDPRNVVERVHAICLTGGSAYGLSAADGVMAGLHADGIGLPMGAPGDVVPLVPTAVVFDLGRGGVFAAHPDATTGRAAYDDATKDTTKTATTDTTKNATKVGPVGADSAAPLAQGCVGAGRGAKAGGLKGGVGTASAVCPDGTTVAALVVCNSLGEVVAADGTFHAAALLDPADLPHGVSALAPPSAAEVEAARAAVADLPPQPVARPGLATTIGVVATDATLTKAGCAKLAGVGHDGLGIAIRPAHTMLDGDTLFGVATGVRPAPDLAAFHDILTVASQVVARAVVRAVLAADTTGTGGTWRSYREAFPSALRPERGPS